MTDNECIDKIKVLAEVYQCEDLFKIHESLFRIIHNYREIEKNYSELLELV